MSKKVVIHTDGGARGNPGPAAAGIVIDGLDKGKKEIGEYLGEMTNNEAEYRAVLIALNKLKSLIGSDKAAETEVEIYVDSELLARQVNGEYKVKEKELQNLFVELWNARLDFKSVTFHHVYREENSGADDIVNQVLDREENKLNI